MVTSAPDGAVRRAREDGRASCRRVLDPLSAARALTRAVLAKTTRKGPDREAVRAWESRTRTGKYDGRAPRTGRAVYDPAPSAASVRYAKSPMT